MEIMQHVLDTTEYQVICFYNQEQDFKYLPSFFWQVFPHVDIANGCVTRTLIEKNIQIATMESCTSGLIASRITDYEGASSILKGSYITYSNEAKILAGVPEEVIASYGVYSKETAYAMARAAKNAFKSDVGIGITGSFGNADPANPDSVCGEIYFHIDYCEYDKLEWKIVWKNNDEVAFLPRKDMKSNTVDIVLKILYALLQRER